MISLFLLSGLGNQMFEYAFARALALRKGSKLRLSRSYFKKEIGRDYALNNLSLPDDVKLMNRFQEFITGKKFYLEQKIDKIKKHGRKCDFYNNRVIRLIDFDKYNPAYDKFVPDFIGPNFGRKNIILLGYFQTRKYFYDFESQIKKELKVSTPPSTANALMIEELKSCESVCVHVRRGDYLSIKWNEICSYEYYESAMKYISERVNSPVFYFFSNNHEEIEWIKNNWNFPGFKIKYVDLNNPDYEELRLMYSCRHFIIANSSFSWWGSYLSGSPNKIICAPSKWIDERPIEKTNIFLPEWKIIHTK